MGAELEKGRNLWAESSGGQIWKGPKPLATHLDIVQWFSLLEYWGILLITVIKYPLISIKGVLTQSFLCPRPERSAGGI